VPDNKLPPNVIKAWPDVLKDIEVDVLPLEYLDTIRVTFTNGKIWEIDIQSSLKKSPIETLEETIETMFKEYDQDIENVDFRLDTARIKDDIKRRTHKFMKKRR